MNQLKRVWHAVFNVAVWGYGLFWSWNLIFLAFIAFGFVPTLLPELIRSLQEGLTPLIYLLYFAILIFIPILAVILGATLLRREPGKLLALGYGVEGPLMILLLVRFFMVRDAIASINFLSALAALGIVVMFWQILDRRMADQKPGVGYLRLVGLTLLLCLGLYVGAWLAFYAIPAAALLPGMVREILRGLWETLKSLTWASLGMLPLYLLGTLLGLYTATLLAALPVAVPVLYLRAWLRGARAVASRQNWITPGLATLLTALLCLAAFIATNQQPQHKAYQLLAEPPQTLAQAESLGKDEPALRAGLLNAYLAPLRYISAVGEVGHIRELYQWAFSISDQAAIAVESLYEWVARPLLYEPMDPDKLKLNPTNRWQQQAMNQEPAEAARLYEAYFDQTILQGERETLVRAALSTWSGDQALSDWQAVDEREIHLSRQELTVAGHGDWAEVELYEVYLNQTAQRQEVVYYFSLPESAVLTGLWLGNSPDRENRFVYHIAPRGAAQQVYREQVRYNMDPALLEQIGPSQYRLRAFPVEPRQWDWNETTRTSTPRDGPPLYLWMTFQVFRQANGWPLPYLAEHRNVYWDASTVRLLNNQPLKDAAKAWLPACAPAQGEMALAAHQVTFPSGETVILRPADASLPPALPSDLRLALVLDRSRSMQAYRQEVNQALASVEALNAQVDAYLTASAYRGEGPSLVKLADLAPETAGGQIVYLGGQNAVELLRQFQTLRGGRQYDAILVLTDGTGFKLGGQAVLLETPEAPVWMIHLDGRFPLGYDDSTLQAIQASGGGVAANVEDVLARLALSLPARASPASAPSFDRLDGFEWSVYPAGSALPEGMSAIQHASDDPFAAFAARRLILDVMRRQRANITDLAMLDHLHQLAQTYSLVTPYSSMLVLVNPRQEQRLEDLENQEDRFAREGEAVGETLSPFQVTGVPEPHEWLLIGLAVAMLLWYAGKTGKLEWVKRFQGF